MANFVTQADSMDAGGAKNPAGISAKLPARFSAANAENIAQPTASEVKKLEGGHH